MGLAAAEPGIVASLADIVVVGLAAAAQLEPDDRVHRHLP